MRVDVLPGNRMRAEFNFSSTSEITRRRSLAATAINATGLPSFSAICTALLRTRTARESITFELTYSTTTSDFLGSLSARMLSRWSTSSGSETATRVLRSEERRVGKEGRCGGASGEYNQERGDLQRV